MTAMNFEEALNDLISEWSAQGVKADDLISAMELAIMGINDQEQEKAQEARA